MTFLTPGIVIVSAVFSGKRSSMGMLEDRDRGVLERCLATPARRAPVLPRRLSRTRS